MTDPRRTAEAGAAEGRDPRVLRSRQAVLAAALALMVERGVFALTIDAVADRSGVAKTTIYRHWPNRDALLADAWAAIPPPEVPDPTGDVDADLLAVAHAIHVRLSTPPMSVLLPDLLAAAERDRTRSDLHDQLLRARRRPVLQVVRHATLDGRLPADLDADLVVSLVLGPLLYQRLIAQEPTPPRFVERIVAAVLAAARAGLLTR